MFQLALLVPAKRSHQKFENVGMYIHDDLFYLRNWIQLPKQFRSGQYIGNLVQTGSKASDNIPMIDNTLMSIALVLGPLLSNS